MSVVIHATGPTQSRTFAYPDADASVLTSLGASLVPSATVAIAATQAGRGPLHVGMGANADPVLAFGYNHKADYTVVTASEPGLAWMLEANYDDGSGQNKMEGYLQYLYADGSGKYNRAFMMQWNRVTNLPVETGLSGGTGGVTMYNNTGAGTPGQLQFVVGTLVAQFGPAVNRSLLPTAIGLATFAPATLLQVNDASLFGTAVTDTVTISQSLSAGNSANPSSLGAIAWRTLGNVIQGRLNVVDDNPGGSTACHMEFWTTPSGGVVREAVRLTGAGALVQVGTLAIGAISTDGVVLENATLATAGVPVQQSPRLRFRSHVWNTTVTAIDNTNDWWIEVLPASGATPSSILRFGKSLNGGTITYPLAISTIGTLQFGGSTASFPGLGTTGAQLAAVLADGSNYTSFAASLFQVMTAIVAAGGGAAPTFTTIGGSGPVTAAQNGWLKMLDSAGASCWVPAWK